MGFDHAALSAALLTHWGLPEVLIEAVRWRPAEADGGPAEPHLGTTGSIVHLAEWIARLLADGRAESLGQLLSIGRREHRLSPEQLGALVEVLEGKVQSLADVLSLELLHTEGYQELLAEAHARLSDVAASTAADMLHREQAGTDASCATATLSNEMRCLGAATARLTPRPREPAAEHEAAPSAPATAGVERLVTAPALPREEHAASAEGDWNLLRQLADAVATSRRLRCPLSLLLVELGETEELVLHHGLPGFHHVRTVAEKACRTVDHGRATCIPYGGAGFAVILVDCDRQLAVRLGNQIVDRVARCTVGGPAAKHPTLGIGVGAATVCLPPKNFPAKDLLVAANRCLYGSHTCGGGVVKSIEIY
jgi:GGDEF domain-containing protein